MKKYKQNWFFIFIFFSIVGLSFFIWEIETYKYLCESEDNAPACFILHNKFKEKEDIERSLHYLSMSCDKKYNLACEKLNEFK